MLRQLLAVSEYRVHMRKKVYSGLVLFYLSKAKMAVCSREAELSTSKEELFRSTLTLHSLLENPPGDFPDDLRKDLIQGFIEIFLNLRHEEKIARKLLACVNSFLMKDGSNLGSCAQEIHVAAQDFVVRSWLTTHDRSFKDGLFLYARIQLKFRGFLFDGATATEQLLDLVVKELDQSSITAPGAFRNYDGGRDDKVRTITSSQRSLMELAAAVFYEACIKVDRSSSAPKRLKRENINFIIKDRLTKAKWLWFNVSVPECKNVVLEAFDEEATNAQISAFWFLENPHNFPFIVVHFHPPFTEKILKDMGHISGKALQISKCTKENKIAAYTRICTELDLEEGLMKEIILEVGHEWRQEVDYEGNSF
eukprot:Gb_40155 [translate_table: standard]